MIVCVVRNPPCAPVAQLDRVPGYEPVGRGFESLQARHVAASDMTLAATFLQKSPRTHFAASPLSQKVMLAAAMPL